MSVIPLIIDQTVVERKEHFQVEGWAVRIGNLDPAQFRNKDTSNVSYDFRVGNKYRSHLEDTPRQLQDGETITLRPRAAFIIETAEHVHLPRRLFGIIAPRVSLLQKGLSTTFSKVDPGYDGPLLITLFNLGQTTQVLEKGEGFCAFSVIEVGEGAELYQKRAQQLDAKVNQRLWDRIRNSLEAYRIFVEIFLIVATVFLAIVEFTRD